MSGKYFLSEMAQPEVSERTVFEMKPVLFRPNDLKIDGVLYTVYKNLKTVENIARYDITEISSKKISGEFAKTFGHYHKGPSPELYEVLEGRAYFLIQKYEDVPGKISEAYIIEAGAGEKAVIPPNFGHITINVGESDLVLANWTGFEEHDYETIKKYRGGCYYVLDGGNNIEFEKNTNYASVPDLKKLRPKNMPELGIKQDKDAPIWDLHDSPGKLDWLAHPEKYSDVLTIEKLYREI